MISRALANHTRTEVVTSRKDYHFELQEAGPGRLGMDAWMEARPVASYTAAHLGQALMTLQTSGKQAGFMLMTPMEYQTPVV